MEHKDTGRRKKEDGRWMMEEVDAYLSLEKTKKVAFLFDKSKFCTIFAAEFQ